MTRLLLVLLVAVSQAAEPIAKKCGLGRTAFVLT